VLVEMRTSCGADCVRAMGARVRCRLCSGGAVESSSGSSDIGSIHGRGEGKDLDGVVILARIK
jgi:hypothetical protein